jgi:uncharacterized damage-inducible protein DinB
MRVAKANDRSYFARHRDDRQQFQETARCATLQRLFEFKAWANDELLRALARLGSETPLRGLAIRRLAIKALSHTHVVDRIFFAHLTRQAHAYGSANLSQMPTLDKLSADIR